MVNVVFQSGWLLFWLALYSSVHSVIEEERFLGDLCFSCPGARAWFSSCSSPMRSA